MYLPQLLMIHGSEGRAVHLHHTLSWGQCIHTSHLIVGAVVVMANSQGLVLVHWVNRLVTQVPRTQEEGMEYGAGVGWGGARTDCSS